MKIGYLSTKFLVGGALVLAGGTVWAAQAGMQLWVNGKVATADARVINGRVYVPLADVAKALNMVVTKKGAGYDMSPEGGANQLNGSRQGKVGDRLVTPKWNFMVRGVHEADEYTEMFCTDKKTLKPKGADDRLVIVDCTISNGLKQKQSPVLSERLCGNTGLADTNGQSYEPMDFDARQLTDKIGSYEATPLLPGAKSDFALVFSVPKSVKAKALVFTLLTYPDSVGAKTTTDVRVSLGE
jgi:hypothetical protein